MNNDTTAYDRVLAVLRARTPFYLTYVGQGEGLGPDAVAAWLLPDDQRELAMLTPELDEWQADYSRDSADRELEDACDAADVDLSDLTDDQADELRTFIYDNDDADTIADLLRQTGRQLLRMTIEPPDGHYCLRIPREYRAAQRSLIRALVAHGLTTTSAYRWVADVLPECGEWIHEGCALDVIWHGDVSGIGGLPDGSTLTFTDPYVVLLDTLNGSGMDGRVSGTLTLTVGPDARPRLDSGGPGYGWDDTAGVYRPAFRADPAVTR